MNPVAKRLSPKSIHLTRAPRRTKMHHFPLASRNAQGAMDKEHNTFVPAG